MKGNQPHFQQNPECISWRIRKTRNSTTGYFLLNGQMTEVNTQYDLSDYFHLICIYFSTLAS